MKKIIVGMLLVAIVLGIVVYRLGVSSDGFGMTRFCMNNSGLIGWQAK